MLANGDSKSGCNELSQVRLQLMIGKARHGNGVFAFIPAGQGKIQDPGHRFGVFVKQLVEIAHTKEQKRVRAGAWLLRIVASSA